jgi:potassium-transporting ATPase potassium-binding subunit
MTGRAALLLLFLSGLFVSWSVEMAGNPRLHALGGDPSGGDMEGKEARFGIFDSVLFAKVTTGASCGAVNAMHDSYTPLGGLVLLINIELGEVVFDGVGAGLYGMLVFVILAVFLAGLMVGRTPEYLGKKIESHDVKLCVIALLVLVFDILGFTAWAVVNSWGVSGLNNTGPHGLSEVLYAFSSAADNNGSAFAGLNTDTYWFNITLGLAMLIGRFLFLVPVLALAGHLAKKKPIAATGGSFPVSGDGAEKRPGHERSGRGGGRRCRCSPSRQDRHHHPGRPPGHRVSFRAGCPDRGAGQCGAIGIAGR